MLNFLKCLCITFIWMVISVLYPKFGFTAEQYIIILPYKIEEAVNTYSIV